MVARITQTIVLLLLSWNLVLSSEQQKIGRAFGEIKTQLDAYELGNAFSDDVIQKALKFYDCDIDRTVEALITSLENKIDQRTESAVQSDAETCVVENTECGNSTQTKIKDIDRMPSLRNTVADNGEEMNNKRKRIHHDADEINNALENQQNHVFPNEFHEEKTEEQLEYEKSGNKLKNFFVGEIVLINGLTTGPECVPLPNGKLADIRKGPVYKKNQNTQLVQERYDISIESKIKASMPSEFLHKISREDIEQLWKQKLYKGFEQKFGWDLANFEDLVDQLKLNAYQNYEAAQIDFQFLGQQFSYDDVVGALKNNDYYLLQTCRYLSAKNESKIPSPGLYSVVGNLIRVTDKLNINDGETIKKLKKGDIVEVFELKEVPEDERIRGRIEVGWISITNTSNGKRFAEPKHFVDWRQKLTEDFGPFLRNLGWNDADIGALIETFADKNFSQYSNSYDTAKTIFGDLCNLYSSDGRLQSAFHKISQIDERKQFLNFPIRTTIITSDYNLDRVMSALYDMQKKIERYQSAQATECSQSQPKQKNIADRCDIGEMLRPGSTQDLLIVDDHDDTQSNVLNPQQLVKNLSNNAYTQFQASEMESCSVVELFLLAAETGDQYSLAVITEMVIDQGVDVNSRNIHGRTALHFAAIGGHDNCLELLLTLQADLFAFDDSGQSVTSEYIRAISHNVGSMAGLRNLMEHGARPSTADVEFLEEASGKEGATDLVKEATKYLKQVEFQNKKI